MVVVSAVMFWNILKLTLWTASPIVVVLSGSMEPAMYRGDILLLAKVWPIETGDIVVYDMGVEAIPIVHRIVSVQERVPKKGTNAVKENDVTQRRYLTKGDNNNGDDRALYPKGVLYIEDKHVVGRVVGIVPYAGYATIILNDYPLCKYLMLGGMLVSMLLSKE